MGGLCFVHYALKTILLALEIVGNRVFHMKSLSDSVKMALLSLEYLSSRKLLCGIPGTGCECGSENLLLKGLKMLLIKVQLSFAFVKGSSRSLKVD